MGVDPPLLAVGKKRLLEEYRAALCELVKVQLRSRMVKLDTAAGRIVHMSEMERSAVRERERATRWRATQLDRSLSDADLPSGVGLGLLGDLLRIGMY
ncbi:hypothetical protein Ct61P_15457 [Colletotrichum tofieldiae]|nr:hypothetical protein Ct61P_15457 [Colletotrichum tofieldiae]